MFRLLSACLCAGLLSLASQAHAYDLSRSYAAQDQVERGFVVAQGGLWFPGFGTFNEFHQLSLDFAGEFGFRFAAFREHNLFFVAGFSFSPQQLDPNVVPDTVRGRNLRASKLFLGWGGMRYVPGMLCIGDGLGCPFVELRIGVVYEDADDDVHPGRPKGEITVLPGVGYRFRFGSSFQLGVRADIAVSGEDDDETLAWLALGGFIGFGW